MRGVATAAAVLAFFAALTALVAFPLSLAPGSRAIPLSADTRLFLWTLGWDVHALLTDPLGVFDANIFFPERRTLAYSEHLLGSALLGAPFLLTTGNPVLAMNVVVLLSCVMSGAGATLLARRLGIGWAGALAAGVVFAFAPPRFARLAQVHLATVQWIPFCLAFLHAYARERRPRDLVWAAAFFTLQSLTSGHGGLFLALAGGLILGLLAAFSRLPPPGRLLRDLGITGTLLLAVNAAFLLPYFQVQREVGLHRTLGAVYDWAPNGVSFLAAETHAQKAVLGVLGIDASGARAVLFPGWIVLALALVALRRQAGVPPVEAETPPARRTPRWLAVVDALVVLVALVALGIHVAGGVEWTLGGVALSARDPRRATVALAVLVAVRLVVARRQPFAFGPGLRRAREAFRRHAEARTGLEPAFYAVLAGLAVWACLGPGYGLYTVLYRLVPGFDLVRVPSRLMILALLGLAVLAGLGLERLLAVVRAPRGRAAAAVAALALLGGEFLPAELGAKDYPLEFPAVDRWLAGQPKPFTAVELPVADPGDATRSARLHSHYMLHSTLHWQPIVNGYSGLVPPRHERLFRILTAFPDEASLRELETLGVRYAVLHREFCSPAEWEKIVGRADGFADRLTLEADAGDGRVYALSAVRRIP